ncbi:MAG: hypothetical protein DRH43_01490 [Deltaproteobacteria bacterium]|nr:MAG: hypothetical protein DRH43_01490 [Deltaproteobacteria bacterium]
MLGIGWIPDNELMVLDRVNSLSLSLEMAGPAIKIVPFAYMFDPFMTIQAVTIGHSLGYDSL